ncbi:hypothetical protein BJX61DRAFT_533035 [Aspergillus egyptiacus]|nr:hypothetical protein BJX61DRAFT_533035 [Aspergillus egyptiacus]
MAQMPVERPAYRPQSFDPYVEFPELLGSLLDIHPATKPPDTQLKKSLSVFVTISPTFVSTAASRFYWSAEFIVRGCVLLLVPPLITVYFILICFVYRAPDFGTLKYSDHRNGQLVYYSWWILGLFNLGMSRGQSWSGFGGWMRCLGLLIRKRQMPVQRLWWLLSVLSLLITVALPLSGLSMELFDGFIATFDPPFVIGYSQDTFLKKRLPEMRALPDWGAGIPQNLPGAGIVYTPLNTDRSQYPHLTDFPNKLPIDHNVSDIFLAPQARYPVAGRPWGLRLSYNCSTDFIRYTDRSSWSYRTLENGNEEIRVSNCSEFNLFAYIEQAVTFPTLAPETARSWDEVLLDPDIMEYVMWQVRSDQISEGYISTKNVEVPFNDTVYPTITGLGHPLLFQDGVYRVNSTFLAMPPPPGKDAYPAGLHEFVDISEPISNYAYLDEAPVIGTAAPIGIRCQVASQYGYATLHPDSYSFSDFRSFLPSQTDSFGLPLVLGEMSTRWLLPIPFENNELFQSILESINSQLLGVNSKTGGGELSGYLQPDHLRASMLCAWATEALHFMYDGRERFEHAHPAQNMTGSRPGKILGPGSVPPHIAATLFSIWAIGCVILALRYGFQPRWAETLDAYSVFREFHEIDELQNLPGLIGDSQIHMRVGKIGLVEEGYYARRDKLYQ